MSVWFRADDGLSQFAEPMGHFSTTSTAADLPCKTEGRPNTKAPTSGDGVGALHLLVLPEWISLRKWQPTETSLFRAIATLKLRAARSLYSWDLPESLPVNPQPSTLRMSCLCYVA